MVVSGRPNLVYSPGPGLWSLVLGPFGPDLGPDLDLTWDLDLDLSLTIMSQLCIEQEKKLLRMLNLFFLFFVEKLTLIDIK